jgi:hypothetical protein
MQILRELIRLHHERAGSSSATCEFRLTDIVRFSNLPQRQVEEALEILIDLRAVTRHSLGQFTLTRSALDEFGLVAQPWVAATSKR